MITAYGRNRCRQRRAPSSLGAVERMIRSTPSSTRTTFFPIVQVPVGLKRVGREMRMLVENADDQTPAACPLMCRFLGRLHHKTIHALPRQTSEKRQGTKSRAGRGSVSPLRSMGI